MITFIKNEIMVKAIACYPDLLVIAIKYIFKHTTIIQIEYTVELLYTSRDQILIHLQIMSGCAFDGMPPHISSRFITQIEVCMIGRCNCTWAIHIDFIFKFQLILFVQTVN